MRRLIAVGIPVALSAAWAFYLAVLWYTFAFGEKATATVARCRPSSGRRGSRPECHGTWRTEGGEIGEGGIYNLNPREAPGDIVPVRIGPLGPYANGWDRAWVVPVVWGGYLLIFLIIWIVVYRWKIRPGLRLAESILTASGALIVSDDAVRHPDGSPHVLVRHLPDPPLDHQRLDLPGRTERKDERPGPSRRIFQSVLDADERPVMLLEHRSDKKLNPETVLLDPSGTPKMLLRRVSENEYRLLDPTGAEHGSARPADGVRTPALQVWDADENMVAMAARHKKKWVLRIEEDAPQPLREAALVLALVQNRTIY